MVYTLETTDRMKLYRDKTTRRWHLKIGKRRPFGNSSWKFELYTALVKHKAVRGDFDEDGYLDDVDTEVSDNIINQCILDL